MKIETAIMGLAFRWCGNSAILRHVKLDRQEAWPVCLVQSIDLLRVQLSRVGTESSDRAAAGFCAKGISEVREYREMVQYISFPQTRNSLIEGQGLPSPCSPKFKP